MLNDEYLVYLYRQGNDWALAELFQKYLPIMRKGILTNNNELKNLAYDQAECLSKCYLNFFQCIDSYCEHKEVSFGAYACLKIQYVIKNYGRRLYTKKMKTISYDALDLGEGALEINETQNDPTKVVGYQMYDEILKNMIESAKGVERAVLTCMVAGYSTKEIKMMLPYDVKTISNALYRVRRKMKKVGKEL